MRSWKAFTMMELMIVVAIIGILAAIATPSFQAQIRLQRARADVKAVEHALLKGRDFAKTHIRCLEVKVSTTTVTLTPYQNGTTNELEPCDGASVAITDEVMTFEFEHISLGNFASPGLTGDLWFNRRGSPLDPTTGKELLDVAVLSIAPEVGGTQKIRVYPITGTVRLVR